MVDADDDTVPAGGLLQGVETFVYAPFSIRRCLLIKKILSVLHVQHGVVFVPAGVIGSGQIDPYASVPLELWDKEGGVDDVDLCGGGMLFGGGGKLVFPGGDGDEHGGVAVEGDVPVGYVFAFCVGFDLVPAAMGEFELVIAGGEVFYGDCHFTTAVGGKMIAGGGGVPVVEAAGEVDGGVGGGDEDMEGVLGLGGGEEETACQEEEYTFHGRKIIKKRWRWRLLFSKIIPIFVLK